jgi:transitional endoplasmic reticulum ATPase
VLRKLYPHHSVVLTTDYQMNLMAYPGVLVEPLKDVPLITSTFFLNLPRNSSPKPGLLLDNVEFGAFKVSWTVSHPLLPESPISKQR